MGEDGNAAGPGSRVCRQRDPAVPDVIKRLSEVELGHSSSPTTLLEQGSATVKPRDAFRKHPVTIPQNLL